MSHLTLDHASKILQGARQAARSANYKPMGIAVLDASGQLDRKSTRLNSSHMSESRMPSSA